MLENRDRCPLVSIGLPVYNAENYLDQALESILNQSYEHFELIISDNGSVDQTQAICERYSAIDPRIRYYRNSENLGAAWNFNRVWELASGKFFKWHAHDDLLAIKFLERCIEVLEANSDIVLCHTKVDIISEDGQLYEHYGIELETDDCRPVRRFRELLIKWQRCFPIFGVIRSDTLRKTPVMGNYGHADGVLLARLGLLGQFHEVPEVLFLYRKHEKQSTSVYGLKDKSAGNDYHTYLAWFDPSQENRLSFPQWKILWEYLRSIWMTPLSPSERIRCLGIIIWYGRLRARNLLLDIKKAASFIHYRWSQRGRQDDFVSVQSVKPD